MRARVRWARFWLRRLRARPEISLSVGGDGGAESEFATAGFTVARLKDWDGSSFLLSPAAAPNRPLACGVVEE